MTVVAGPGCESYYGRDAWVPRRWTIFRGLEVYLRYPPDDCSSHEYEVKKVHVDGAEFFAVVFYLRAGEPVNISVDGVLKRVGLWSEPVVSDPVREYRLIFEVQPESPVDPVELYISRYEEKLGVD